MKSKKLSSIKGYSELKKLKQRIRNLEARETLRSAAVRKLRQELAAFQNTSDGIVVTNLDGLILDLNPAGERLTGYSREEVRGKLPPVAFRWVGDVDAKMKEIFACVLEGGRWTGEIHYTRKDGVQALCEAVIVPLRDERSRIVGTMGVHRDLTTKKQIEAEIIKRQKLESAALMASGVAHDFNNLLTAILGNLSLARKMKQKDPALADVLESAEQAARQAARLTGRLLDLARPEPQKRALIDLRGVVEKSIGHAMDGTRVRCDLRAPRKLWRVKAEDGQVGQVIHNLLLNAVESMPRGGTVTVLLENRDLSQRCPLPVARGRYVAVSVHDQGVGIPPDHVPRIFDPYFTTKKKGSGLGLAEAHAIVRNHGGYIFVESMSGAGTTFLMLLPAGGRQGR